MLSPYPAYDPTPTMNVSVHLPPTVFENITTDTIGLFFTYYPQAYLFNASKAAYPFVASPVIGVALATNSVISDLPELITLILPLQIVSMVTSLSNY